LTDPADRMVTAIHEAGHAIVARALSVEVVRVVLTPYWERAERLGVCCTIVRDNPNDCWAHAVLDLAGPLAEQRYANYSDDMLAAMWCTAWKTDRANAERHLGQLEGAVVTMQQAGNMARHLVDEHWDAITRAAQALAWEGELSSTALDRIWREPDALAS
jgi:hypothetical protein